MLFRSRKLQDVQQAIKVVAHLDAATAEKQKNEERILVLGKRNAKIDEELGKLTIEALTQETLTLRNAYTLMVSEKWEIHRANLTEGKPCPLCGSTTHPYHTDNRQFEEATTELSQLLKVKEDLLKQQQIQEKNLSGERKQNFGSVISKSLLSRCSFLMAARSSVRILGCSAATLWSSWISEARL